MCFSSHQYNLAIPFNAGSGKVASASSNGFYIDITPPVVESIHHIDPSWTDYEPTEFQGSNSSIGAYWEVTEDESMVSVISFSSLLFLPF